MSSVRPDDIAIPPPPPLLPDNPASSAEEPATNTYALLLPRLELFAPPILTLLREYYSQFGNIAHWAPVRGFGRVIVVWEGVEGGTRAKEEGDWLKLDVQVPAENPTSGGNGGGGAATMSNGNEYFMKEHRRQSSSSRGITLRLYPLPYTPLDLDPDSLHLAPPHPEKNFLISPPGSPPEGWQPITEDAPNSSTLAEDLQRALEALQLAGKGRGGKEVILEEGGVRVEVEDTSQTAEGGLGADGGMTGREVEVEEVVMDGRGGEGVWKLPIQDGAGTPSGRVRIPPTAMPPVPLRSST